MSSLARWVLSHRRLIALSWLIVAVVGAATVSSATKALSQKFDVPGREGSDTNAQIAKLYHSGGSSSPVVPVVTLPAGKTVSSPGVRPQRQAAFAKIGRALPGARVASFASIRYTDVFCLTPVGIRAGYASAQLVRDLSGSRRTHLQNTIVEILTANHHYSVRGVRPSARLSRVARRLRTGTGYRIGLNTWYLFDDGTSRGLFKVRHGVIEEIGITLPALTPTRGQARRFLRSFS